LKSFVFTLAILASFLAGGCTSVIDSTAASVDDEEELEEEISSSSSTETDGEMIELPGSEVVEPVAAPEKVARETSVPEEDSETPPEKVTPVDPSEDSYVVPGTAGLKDSGKIFVWNMFAGGEADIPITIYNGLPREKVYVLSLLNFSEEGLEEGYVMGTDYASRWVSFPDVMRVPGNSEKTIFVNLSIPKGAETEPKWEFRIRLTEVTEEQILIAYDSRIFVNMAQG